jgi:enamine deaminase RidA (YjgF/YER057c/UK114 family)
MEESFYVLDGEFTFTVGEQPTVKLVVFVNSTPDFAEQHLVANGATDLLLEVLGDAGRTARSAIGVASLPLGFAIEIEAVVRLA